MADQIPRRGRLIAVDGSRGRDVTKAAEALAHALRRRGIECAVSRWDASGLFGELAVADRADRDLSPRTLSLLYAADLAFRLRWEIRSAVDAGGVVIAAPYLETAVALGAGFGLSQDWLRQLLRFAPAPDIQGLARERKIGRGWKPRTDRGYPEYGAALMAQPANSRSTKARKVMIALLESTRGRAVFNLSSKGIDEAAKAAIGTRPAGSSRSASRPRNARK